jgi:hypothetical protein
MLLSTGETLEAVQSSDFLQDVRTVWAGNLGPHRHIVQVTSKNIVLFRDMKELHQLRNPKKRRFRICSAAGNYLLVLLDNQAMAVRRGERVRQSQPSAFAPPPDSR